MCPYAMVRYLQEDHCSLVIASNYGLQTQGIFHTIRKNTSIFTQDLIKDVKVAAQLAVIPKRTWAP